MKLTYRGVSYQPQAIEVKLEQFSCADCCAKYGLLSDPNSHKIILIRPIHFYTYRGVSYTKGLIFN